MEKKILNTPKSDFSLNPEFSNTVAILDFLKTI